MKFSHALIIVICIAVGVRLLALSFALHSAGVEGFISGDAVVYVNLAQNMLDGNGFATSITGSIVPELFRTPGFPLLLSAFLLLGSNGLLLYSVLMCVVAGILLPILSFEIGKRFHNYHTGIIVATMLAIEPHAVFYSFLYQTEMLFVLCAFGGLLCALVAYERVSYTYAAFSGALFGYSVLVRPGFFPVLALLSVACTAVFFLTKDRRYRHMLVLTACTVFMLAPWYMRNHNVAGVYALSGAGWRNVYTDYVSSIRSIKNGTSYHEEKELLKVEALTRFGMQRDEVDNPANGKILRNAALSEMWQNKKNVMKLETALLASFFLNDGYYYEFRMLGFVRDTNEPHISPTYTLLSKGFAGIPDIFHELARQKFIPLIGRLFTGVTIFLAVVGFFVVRSRMRYVYATATILSGLAATAIGLGLDARMRFPVEALIFMFAAAAGVWIYGRVQSRYAR